ncbi:MAG: phytoene/squalene synthase family protein [Isosphaeraceae bacterium]
MRNEIKASYDHCQKTARRHAANFYPSFLLLPSEQRRSMCALYAFMRQTDDIADEPGSTAIKAAALGSWRASLDLALLGRSLPQIWPGWPALADTVTRHGIPSEYLHAVIDGVAMDIDSRAFTTFDELYSYCYRVASAVGLCCLHIWGFRSEGGRAEELAEACGIALQLTNILRDVREDALNGRVYLPLDDLFSHGVKIDELRGETTSQSLRALLAFEGRRAYDYYRKAEPLGHLISPTGRPVFHSINGVYRSLLDEIARRDYDVLPGRVSIPGWRKAAITVRAFAGRFVPFVAEASLIS